MICSNSHRIRRAAALLAVAAAGSGIAGAALAETALARPALSRGKSLPGGKWIPKPNAAEFLGWSTWATVNKVEDVGCTGTGPGRTNSVYTAYHTFRCKVKTYDGAKATVTATALGPEWLHVKDAGGLKSDPGVGGPVPKGPKLLNDSDASQQLQHSRWASEHDVDDATCTGIGPYETRNADYLFGAFQCYTTTAVLEPEAIVRVVNAHSIQVVRSIAAPK